MTFILLDGAQYNEKSIEWVKDFILNCKQILGENPFLWIAFQSNSLNDLCFSSENFESEFKEMIEFLRNKLKFYSPTLTLNMRNSSEVGKLAKTMKIEGDISKITNVTQSLPTPKSSITSTKPILLPISYMDLKHNYFKLFEKATEKGEMKVILIDSESYFDTKKIKKALLECDIKEEDILIHTLKSNNSKDDIKEFLANENGFLICEAEVFTGMEADSVIYCVTDDYPDFDKNVRLNVMRACSKLNIVYAYENDNHYYFDFSSAKLDPTFMNGCDEEMENFALKCFKCEKKDNKFDNDKEDENDVHVCKSCFIRCHSGHEVESFYHKKEIVKCECKTKCLNCNFMKK